MPANFFTSLTITLMISSDMSLFTVLIAFIVIAVVSIPFMCLLFFLFIRSIFVGTYNPPQRYFIDEEGINFQYCDNLYHEKVLWSDIDEVIGGYFPSMIRIKMKEDFDIGPLLRSSPGKFLGYAFILTKEERDRTKAMVGERWKK